MSLDRPNNTQRLRQRDHLCQHLRSGVGGELGVCELQVHKNSAFEN